VNVGEIAKEWYEKNEPEGALAAAILRCFFRGVIVRLPDVLLMAYECRTDGHHIIPGEPFNCWWIEFTTFTEGFNPDLLATFAPHSHEYFAFRRKNKIRVIPWERLDYGRRAVSTNNEAP